MERGVCYITIFTYPNEHIHCQNMDMPIVRGWFLNQTIFWKTHIAPLCPPHTNEAAKNACISALQIGADEKAMKLSILCKPVMAPQLLNKITVSDPILVLQVRANTSRNLVIWSAAYKIVNQSTVIPAQKLKDVMRELNLDKQIKILNEIPKPSWMQLDSSSGLYTTSKLRLSTRMITDNIEQYNKHTAAKRANKDMKIANSNKERNEGYITMLATISKTKENITLGISVHKNTADILKWCTNTWEEIWSTYQMERDK